MLDYVTWYMFTCSLFCSPCILILSNMLHWHLFTLYFVTTLLLRVKAETRVPFSWVWVDNSVDKRLALTLRSQVIKILDNSQLLCYWLRWVGIWWHYNITGILSNKRITIKCISTQCSGPIGGRINFIWKYFLLKIMKIFNV